jgi:hypothetical protein
MQKQVQKILPANGHEQKQTSDDPDSYREKRVFCFCSSPFFAGTQALKFFPLAFAPALRFCHALCARFLFFVPCGAMEKSTQPTSACTGLWPPLSLAGGQWWRPCPLFVRALFRARLPRTPTRLARARWLTHV